MAKVKVDHSGAYRTKPKPEKNQDGDIHYFERGVPVELPDEAIEALGDSAKPTDEKTAEEKDVRKAPFNKMVEKPQIVSK